jgi:hypothetical protein
MKGTVRPLWRNLKVSWIVEKLEVINAEGTSSYPMMLETGE